MTSSASRRSSTRRTKPSSKRRNQADAFSVANGANSAAADPMQPPTNMADRYYAMAEEMNSRGAMELAVPFYRQALALLMAERQQLKAQLPADQLNGLLAAAEHWEQQQPATQAPGADLEQSIAELSQDLSPDSAHQVLAALLELETAHQGLGGSGWSLRGKAAILLGQTSDALAAFREACRLEPHRPDYRINQGGALLACGATAEALQVLKGVGQGSQGELSVEQQIGLLRNLAAAEARSGNLAGALLYRRQWLQRQPGSEPVEHWLQWAQQGLASEQPAATRQLGLELLQNLHQLHPEHRGVMGALAEALEAQGLYREASLLYRSLLRPAEPMPTT